MNVTHARLDLQELGYIDSYELSGREGELVHEFQPILEDVEGVALVVLEGASAERLSLMFGGEPLPGTRYSTRRGRGGEAVVLGVHEPGAVAHFAFSGGQPVMLHFAVFRRIRESFGALVDRAIARFRDKCWACKRLVRFLVSLLLTGGAEDATETGAEFLWELLPDTMTDFLKESNFWTILSEVATRLRERLPGHIIAERVCRDLGYCP